MSKFIFKLNKKLGQGIKTIKHVENRSLDFLICKEHKTLNFILIHFGLGNESDYLGIKNFLINIGIKNKEFNIDIYPGYAHGFLKMKNI